VFGVGSGGHFSALSGWLKSGNAKLRTYAADRHGSITFGAEPGPSLIRGVGNQNIVPGVIQAHRDLVDGVEYVNDRQAFRACLDLAEQHGLFVGGSSGVMYHAAANIARRLGEGAVLTLFPDRGELYHDTIWNEHWRAEHGIA
jgi:cysteine synthase A